MNALARIFLFVMMSLSVFMVSGCESYLKSSEGLTTTVVLVRHADRNPSSKNLNDKGLIRAAALPGALKDVPLDAIYSPDKKRNIDTALHLSKERGLSVTVIPLSGVARRLVNENRGKSVLWIGNTTNLPQIFQELGGAGDPPNNYGDLFIMTLTADGKTSVVKRHFGP